MRILFSSILILYVNLCFAQFSKNWKPNPFNYNKSSLNIKLSDYFDLTQSLPTNYVKDGSVDYTRYLMEGISKYSKVIMPNFPVLTTGINVRSNSSLYFPENAKLILQPNAKERYQVIAIHGVENVKIFNPVVIGDRKYHKGSKGEWGFGIDIRQARNIDVYNANVSNCWGDGIVITESSLGNKNQRYNTSNIRIYNAFLDYNRRNGITITGGVNILIQGAVINNSFGTAPQSGLDIEPDNHLAFLDNIKIYDTKINNADKGLTIVLNKFLNNKLSKNVSVDIKNLIVKNATFGILIQKFDSKYYSSKNILGNISITNFESENIKNKIYKKDNLNLFPDLKINGVKY